jgi:2-polyprenyl-3-methyl-5-hydroxy-6-metoxy-1,4-benzoquinol methylase
MENHSLKEEISLGSIDIISYENNFLTIHGWLLHPKKNIDTLKIEINNNQYEPISRVLRQDVENAYPHIEHAINSGFIFHFFLKDIPDRVQIVVYGITDSLIIASIEKEIFLEDKTKGMFITHDSEMEKKQISQQYWDKNVKNHEEINIPISWLDSSMVRSCCVKKISINNQEYPIHQWLLWIKEKFVLTQLNYGLSIGCGSGSLERYAIKNNICLNFDAYDISEKSIAIAKELSKRENFSQLINYFALDVNGMILDHNKYDIIFFGSSLHHIKNLEHVLKECRDSLKPDGIVVLNEYIGPSQFQWTDKQLKIINELLEIIPPGLKVDTITGEIKTNVSRSSIEHMNKNDPSEAIRSAEIIPILNENFLIIDRIDFGGTILHMLLHSIVNDFKPSDEKDLAILRLLGYIEQKFIAENILPSDFTLIVAKKR